jgi:hypothetical protein
LDLEQIHAAGQSFAEQMPPSSGHPRHDKNMPLGFSSITSENGETFRTAAA